MSASDDDTTDTDAGSAAPGAEERAAERRLVERVLDGERDAFVELVEQYERLVQHVVYRMVDDDRDREELCQDVFVRVHRYLDGFRFESKLSTWIARIARNTCLNHLEKKQMPLYADQAAGPSDAAATDARELFNRIPDEGDTPADETADRHVYDAIHDAIDTLPEHYRTALTLYHLEGMSVQEVADAMDNPEGTTKSHLYRARKKLKDRLLEVFSAEELQLR
jgi:RNA polymerase sigma-70 factor (ECF subfamily)